jgi:hypothetical protein
MDRRLRTGALLLALVAAACASPSATSASNPAPSLPSSSAAAATGAALPTGAAVPTVTSPPAVDPIVCKKVATLAEVIAKVRAVPGLKDDLTLFGPTSRTENPTTGPFRGLELTTCDYISNAASVSFAIGRGSAATILALFNQGRPKKAVDVAGLGDAAYWSFESQLYVVQGTTFLAIVFAAGGAEYGETVGFEKPEPLHVPLAELVLPRLSS